MDGIDGVDAGDPVTAQQMRTLFGHGLHPLADARAQHFDGSNITLHAIDDATRLGTPFRFVDEATPFRVEVAKRIAELNGDRRTRRRRGRGLLPGPDPNRGRERVLSCRARPRPGRRPRARSPDRERLRPRSQTVAGYDLTFSPVKSVSTLWAVADPRTAVAIERAHRAAVADALRFIEEQALFTRTGPQGIRQVNVHGLVAAAFTHRDSRAGDPDLHTHVAVANKVQTLDGRWLSIDGRVLFKAKVAASETYNTALERHLRDALGVRFAERPGTDPAKRPIREIVGVDPRLNERWSSRRALINARRGELAVQFQADHGRPPTAVEALQLAQQATLETRDAKHEPRSYAEQRATWLDEAAAVLGSRDAVTAMVAAALAPAADAARVRMLDGSARPRIGSWRCWNRPGRPGSCGTSAPKPNARPAQSTCLSTSPTAWSTFSCRSPGAPIGRPQSAARRDRGTGRAAAGRRVVGLYGRRRRPLHLPTDPGRRATHPHRRRPTRWGGCRLIRRGAGAAGNGGERHRA